MKNEVKQTNTLEVKGRILVGTVVSDKMKDTVVVEVFRYIKIPKYEKYVQRSKRYQAHDAGNTKKIGDKVSMRECRPISKNKHFTIVTE